MSTCTTDAAGAESLRQQALQLSELVAAFRLRNAAATAA